MTLNDITEFLGRLYGLPGYVMVFLFCIVWGRVLKTVKWFPSDGIPLAIVLTGAILNSLIADPDGDPLNLKFRIWLVKNALFGAIVGFLAWMGHRFIIKKLLAKFGIASETETNKDTAP